jgi:hypothetical protein
MAWVLAASLQESRGCRTKSGMTGVGGAKGTRSKKVLADF